MNTTEQAIKDFISYCKFEKNLSSKTLKAYQIDLTQFKYFLYSKYSISELTAITKIELRGFLEHLSTMKPKTIKRKIATLKCMFNFLEFEDRILINPIRKTRIKIKEPKVLPKVMTLAEILKIMKCAYRKFDLMSSNKSHPYFESLRDVVILELLFSTGGRVSEIAELNEKQIDLKTGNLVLKGKGDKERVIQICSQETLNILKTYVEIAAEKIKKANGAFLINRFGKQLSDQSIRNMVRKFSVKAKINRNITPHVFRHTFATLLLEKDVDIKYIQSLLGHSSIMTTQLYTHVNRRKQRKILTTKHPRMGISFRSVSSPE